jgi:hypothetical protein
VTPCCSPSTLQPNAIWQSARGAQPDLDQRRQAAWTLLFLLKALGQEPAALRKKTLATTVPASRGLKNERDTNWMRVLTEFSATCFKPDIDAPQPTPTKALS